MKIAHIVSTYPPYFGGMGNAARAMAERSAARGHDVSVLTLKPKIQPTGGDGVPVHRLRPLIRSGNAGILPQLFWLCDDYDIIHLHYPFFGSAEIVGLWKMSHRRGKKNIPLILHYQMDAVADGQKGRFFAIHRKYILPWLLALSDRILVSSDDYAQHSFLAAHPILTSGKMEEIPNGVDLSRFRLGLSHDRIVKRHGIDAGVPVLLFVGGLDVAHRFKGLEVLLRAFAFFVGMNETVRGKHPVLVIVGDGRDKPMYVSLTEELEIAPYVHFAGRVDDDDLPRYYTMADAVILPSVSESEAFGMVLVEAMACGTPVIASRLAGVRTVVDDGITGFLVKPGDVIGLAKILHRALQDTRRQSAMGKAGRRRVETLYSWDVIADRLDQVYASLEKKIP